MHSVHDSLMVGNVMHGVHDLRGLRRSRLGREATGRLFVAGDLEAAERNKRATEEAIAAYEQALTEAKQKAHAIVEEGRAKLKAETDAEQAKLDKQLAQKSAEAAARIEKARDAAMKDINDVATEAAADIVKQLIGVAPSKADVEKAVTAARKA